MKTKYVCEKCNELFDEKDIAYKYQINIGRKYPIWEFVCKKCDKEKDKEEY